ncbi:hypothetical protein [Agrobacterium rosae]|uniref:hypothetical protein n=1 Tax=Agrobacterium rosae TaxID=1972867 RepID=UPI003BA06BE7
MVIDGVFGPWRPDMPDLNNPGVVTAMNVTPGFGTVQGAITYYPIKRASLYSATTMQSRPLGTAVGQDSFGNAKVYGGCAEKLYKMNPLNKQWLDMSRAGGYSTADGERWASSEFGDLVIMTNYTNEPQYVAKSQDVQFGSLTTLFKARRSAVIRDFHVLGNTFDAFDGAVPYRVRWSAFGNPFDYNFSQQTMSDFQDIFEGGSVQAIIGGEAGYVLLQRAIVKMTFIGAPLVFQFDLLPSAKDKGCSVAESVITVDGKTFFLSDDGFYVLQGDQIASIGAGKIDNFFLGDFDTSQAQLMSVAADPAQKLVYWSYRSMDAEDGTPDRLLIYHYGLGEWSIAENTTDFIFNSMSLPWTIEQLDVFGTIENMPAPFDSPLWSGGNAMLWSMDTNGNIFVFGGSNMRGVLETQEMHLMQMIQRADPRAVGDKTTITGVRPLVHGDGAVSVVGAHRSVTTAGLNTTTARPTNGETGYAYFRHQDRYHRFEFRLEGNWTQAMGYQIDAIPAGFR